MICTIRSSLKRSIKKCERGLYANELKNQEPTEASVPVFQYPVKRPDDKRIYVWGLVEHGALGTQKTKTHIKGIRFISKPKRLSFAEYNKVTDVTCGYGFTAFAVSSNTKNILYGTGINTDSQLGFQDTDEKKYPDDLILEPRPVPLPIKSSSTRVTSLAAGRAHLLTLTTEGLFTLGNNAYGQCGRPIIPNENHKRSRTFHYIKDVKGKAIKSVAAGQDHSLLLTENGEVYTFGWGADGQTGLAHYRNEYRPSLVKGDLAGQHIVKVACVADCVLALNDKGKVFGWGNSEYGQLLGINGNCQINIATELDKCNEIGHIVDIAVGGSFCMILTNTGDVYVWGYGILGFGPQVQRVLIPTLLPATLFGKNAYDPNVRVGKIRFTFINHWQTLKSLFCFR